jgi:membrane protein implicated in regulation of membrane protease activity
MHSLGEEIYRRWHVERVQETRITVYLFCLAGNTLLTAGVGAALIYFSNLRLVPFAIGMGMVAYAIAVAFYTLLAIWRIRRAAKKLARRQNSATNGKSLTADTWVRVENRAPDKII